MTKSRFFRGLGHFPVDRPCYIPTSCPCGPIPTHRAGGLGRGGIGGPKGLRDAHRSSIPHQHLQSGARCRRSQSCSSPISCGSGCHAAHRRGSQQGRPCRRCKSAGRWGSQATGTPLWGNTHCQGMEMCHAGDKDFGLFLYTVACLCVAIESHACAMEDSLHTPCRTCPCGLLHNGPGKATSPTASMQHMHPSSKGGRAVGVEGPSALKWSCLVVQALSPHPVFLQSKQRDAPALAWCSHLWGLVWGGWWGPGCNRSPGAA